MTDITLEQVLVNKREAVREIASLDEERVKLVIVGLADQYFAFHGERIREILAHAEVFFVPGCPASMEGVINVRGDIESVVRLHVILELPDGGIGPDAPILLGKGGGMSSGLRVDRVVDVIDLPQSAIQPPPATLPEHLRSIALGALLFQGLPVAVLDLDRLFADYARGLG